MVLRLLIVGLGNIPVDAIIVLLFDTRFFLSCVVAERS